MVIGSGSGFWLPGKRTSHGFGQKIAGAISAAVCVWAFVGLYSQLLSIKPME